jgi:phosphoribosyl-AMP cyclohydrolase
MIRMGNLHLNFRHEINGEKLIIAVAQDYKTCEVLMVAYMNRDALQRTLETGKVHYWSTSRGKIWLKGESSGNFQMVKEIYLDCDADTLLIKAKQIGGACHEGYYSCFFRKFERDKLKIIKEKVFEPKKTYGEN